MAWKIVETPNAKYVLIFSRHFNVSEESPIGFDALVLEPAKNIIDTVGCQQYRDLIAQAIKSNKQVWVTDAEPTGYSVGRFSAGLTLASCLSTIGFLAGGEKLAEIISEKKVSRRDVLKIAKNLALATPFSLELGKIWFGRGKNKITHEKLWEIMAKTDELIVGKGLLLLRNALTAEKAEGFIAPRLRRELGRKPVIAMVWEHRTMELLVC